MIENERQYGITRAQIRRFEEALAAAPAAGAELHPLLRQAAAAGLESQLRDLRREAGEYEALRAGAAGSLRCASLRELPEALIKARIASGLNQRQLGGLLGLKEQQVQRYEASRYSAASFSRVLAVAEALGLDLAEPALLALARGASMTYKPRQPRPLRVADSAGPRVLESPPAADEEGRPQGAGRDS